jgi:homocysteine S-methyltransferase
LSAPVTCQLIQQEAWIEAVLHVSRGIPSELLGAYKLGIPNVICGAADGLTTIVDHLNRGLDLGGNPMGSQTALLLGVEVNPSADDLDGELRRFEAQVKAGAEFAVTQPVFDLDLLEVFLKFGIPVIGGIRPLTSVLDAEFVVNELRIAVPEEYVDRMRNADDPNAEGVAIAKELIQCARQRVAGILVRGAGLQPVLL